MGARARFEELEVGKIYVTRGGLARIPHDKSRNITPDRVIKRDDTHIYVGWGFDRLKIVKKDDEKGVVVLATPWKSEMTMNKSRINSEDRSAFDALYITTETKLKSVFDVVAFHDGRDELTFDEALKMDITKENDNDQVNNLPTTETEQAPTDDVSKLQKAQEKRNASVSRLRKSSTEKDALRKQLIEFFTGGPKKMVAAKEHFADVPYQNLRYNLFGIKTEGCDGKRYQLIETDVEGKKAYELKQHEG